VNAGLTPVEALQAATANSARALGLTDVGTIKVGNVANAVLLDADPLRNIANTTKIDAVVLRGAVLTRDRLNQLLERTAAASPSR